MLFRGTQKPILVVPVETSPKLETKRETTIFHFKNQNCQARVSLSLSRLRPLLKPNFEFERIFEEFQFSNLHRVGAMKMECVKKPFLLFS